MIDDEIKYLKIFNQLKMKNTVSLINCYSEGNTIYLLTEAFKSSLHSKFDRFRSFEPTLRIAHYITLFEELQRIHNKNLVF